MKGTIQKEGRRQQSKKKKGKGKWKGKGKKMSMQIVSKLKSASKFKKQSTKGMKTTKIAVNLSK